jgi:hypothetical protein
MGVAEVLEAPQCASCIHKDEGDMLCKAFPFGIPSEVYENIILHDHLLAEQIGDYIYKEI